MTIRGCLEIAYTIICVCARALKTIIKVELFSLTRLRDTGGSMIFTDTNIHQICFLSKEKSQKQSQNPAQIRNPFDKHLFSFSSSSSFFGSTRTSYFRNSVDREKRKKRSETEMLLFLNRSERNSDVVELLRGSCEAGSALISQVYSQFI